MSQSEARWKLKCLTKRVIDTCSSSLERHNNLLAVARKPYKRMPAVVVPALEKVWQGECVLFSRHIKPVTPSDPQRRVALVIDRMTITDEETDFHDDRALSVLVNRYVYGRRQFCYDALPGGLSMTEHALIRRFLRTPNNDIDDVMLDLRSLTVWSMLFLNHCCDHAGEISGRGVNAIMPAREGMWLANLTPVLVPPNMIFGAMVRTYCDDGMLIPEQDQLMTLMRRVEDAHGSHMIDAALRYAMGDRPVMHSEVSQAIQLALDFAAIPFHKRESLLA
jgi:hypothetical protein